MYVAVGVVGKKSEEDGRKLCMERGLNKNPIRVNNDYFTFIFYTFFVGYIGGKPPWPYSREIPYKLNFSL